MDSDSPRLAEADSDPAGYNPTVWHNHFMDIMFLLIFIDLIFLFANFKSRNPIILIQKPFRKKSSPNAG